MSNLSKHGSLLVDWGNTSPWFPSKVTVTTCIRCTMRGKSYALPTHSQDFSPFKVSQKYKENHHQSLGTLAGEWHFCSCSPYIMLHLFFFFFFFFSAMSSCKLAQGHQEVTHPHEYRAHVQWFNIPLHLLLESYSSIIFFALRTLFVRSASFRKKKKKKKKIEE